MNIFICGIILLNPSLVDRELARWSYVTNLNDTDYFVIRTYRPEKAGYTIRWNVYKQGDDNCIYSTERHGSKFSVLSTIEKMENGQLLNEIITLR